MARIVDSGGGSWLIFIADRIKWVALKFKEIEGDVAGVPLLGKYLALPFWWVYFWLDSAQDGIRKFNTYYLEVVAGVQDALEYLGLNDAIQKIFGEWNSLRLSPIIWFKNKLRDLVTGADDLMTSAGRWILDRLRDYNYTIYQWVSDFTEKFKFWLQTSYPHVWQLFSDAKQFLFNLLNSISYDLYSFARDPKGFLQEKLSLWLDLPPGFWINPRQGLWDWLLRELEERFTLLAPRVYRLGERIIRYFWEGVF